MRSSPGRCLFPLTKESLVVSRGQGCHLPLRIGTSIYDRSYLGIDLASTSLAPAVKYCVALLVLLSSVSFGKVLAQAQPPNLVIILVDDLGYGDLSSYGASDLQTPAIDALAASGMRFDRFYANSSVCSPTRASLLSGRYPPMAGVPGVIRTRAEDSWGAPTGSVALTQKLAGAA